MADCPVEKIDSSVTGLRIGREACYRELKTDPILRPFEPNEYTDFGGQPVYVARNPINASRQNQRGRPVNIDSAGGFNQDLTMDVAYLLPGFMFAEGHVKPTTRNELLDETGNLVLTVTVEAGSATVALTSAVDGFDAGSIVHLSGFTNPQNNGVFRVTEATGSSITLAAPTMVAEASVPDEAVVRKVGQRFTAGAVKLDATPNGLPVLTLGTDPEGASLKLQRGEWIYVGGDDAGTSFSGEHNNGWMRIDRLLSDGVVLDKTDGTITTDNGTDLTVEIYVGTYFRNEKDPDLIKQISYTLERSLGRDKSGVNQGEILVGGIANEFQLQLPTANKVTCSFTYLPAFSSTYKDTSGGGMIQAARPDIVPQHAFNTTTDVSRLRVMVNDPVTSNPIPQVGFISEANLSINNGASGLARIGKMGFFGASTANFEVGGTVTTYFTDVDAVRLVHEGADVTVDFSIVFDNHGYLFDVPALAFSEGRLNVEMGSPITLPLTTAAYESKFGNTLSIMQFHYLPDVAEAY